MADAPSSSPPDYPVVVRYGLLLRPQPAFFEWLRLARPEDYEEADPEFWEPNLYLIPEMFNPAEEDEWLMHHFVKLFQHELYQIDPEEEHWPVDLTLDRFREWFKTEIISTIFDVVKGKIEKG